jgi:3-oxoacyl-[acyl-carrier-protein] synthase II
MAHVAELISTTGSGKQNGNQRGECAVVPDDLLKAGRDLPGELTSDRASFIAGRAALLALADAGIDGAGVDGNRIGISVACGLAGQQAMITFASEVREQSVRFVSPIHFPHTVGNYVGGALARSFHLRGPNLTIAGGRGCGLASLFAACRVIESGEADAMLAGGFEALTPILVNALDDPPSIPAEGACLVVLESPASADRRRAPVLAVIRDWREDIALRSPSPFHGLVCGYGITSIRDIDVERIIGRCDGASGAALIAAAIAAARGYECPYADPSTRTCVFRRFDPNELESDSAGNSRFTLLAVSPDGDIHRAELSVRSVGGRT